MTLAWLGLAAALLLVPGGRSPARRRAAALAGRRRLPSQSRGVSSGESGGGLSPGWWLAAPAPTAMALGGCGFCAALAGAAGGPVLGASAGVVVGVAGWLVARGVRRRAADRRAAQVLSAVRLLGAELAAGGNAAAALAAAAEAAPACAAGLHAASGAVARGDDPGPALEPFPDLAGVAAAWRVAEQAGAPLAAVLDRVGADLADRAAARRAVAVATAGARSSAALLAMLPLLGVALGASLGARPGGFLLGSPAGRLVLLIGVLLDAAGTLWTVRLVDSGERVR